VLRRLLLGLLLTAALAPASASKPAAEASRLAVAVAEMMPAQPAAPAERLTPAAEALIIRWEVSSRARYERLLAGVICPGAASGPTWGIGYDGGHQTRSVIARDWAGHPDLDRLTPAAGVTGEARCRGFLPTVVGVRTQYDAALHVFRQTSIPAYTRLARRTFDAGQPGAFDRLPGNAKGALVSLVYNRGGSLAKTDSRREMRTIAYTCVPAGDLHCIARELRSMCRLWAGQSVGAGLCNRRHAEAALVIGTGGKASWQ
jgi:hypothetical protein